jgi:hypothetical protein
MAIQDKTIDLALIELMRTMKALKSLRAARKHGPHFRRGTLLVETAAAKRASLDLTRVLADLRQGR